MLEKETKTMWMHTITINEDVLNELEEWVITGRAEYVAGKLIGLLRANAKIVILDKETEGSEK